MNPESEKIKSMLRILIIYAILALYCLTPLACKKSVEKKLPESKPIILLEDPSGTKINDLYVLGEALEGRDTNLIYRRFTNTELQFLKSVIFVSPAFAMDYHFEDKIVSIDKCLIERAMFDFSGSFSTRKKIVLEAQEFWDRIATLDAYKHRFGAFPVGNRFDPISTKYFLEHGEWNSQDQ